MICPRNKLCKFHSMQVWSNDPITSILSYMYKTVICSLVMIVQVLGCYSIQPQLVLFVVNNIIENSSPKHEEQLI